MSQKSYNLFTNKIYNYNINFNITSDADLSEFWEAMLIRLDFQEHIENISDFVRFIYRLGTIQLNKKFTFYIIIEEDFDNFYFTLNIIKPMGQEYIENLIEKHFKEALYTLKDNKITFIQKKSSIEGTESHTPVVKEERFEVYEEQYTQDMVVENIELKTFDVIDHEELEEVV